MSTPAPSPKWKSRLLTAVGAAALGVHNPDAGSGGVALRAGQDIDARALRVFGPAGSPTAASVRAADAALAGRSADALFFALFGAPKTRWREAYADARVDCPCDAAAIEAAVAHGARKLWLRGGLVLSDATSLGRDDAPLVLVVEGDVRLEGRARLQGLLWASDIVWQAGRAGAAGGQVLGALVSERDFQGDGAPDLRFDAPTLAALQRLHGSFVPVPGTWRDEPAGP